ncbi:MAG: hypothetical protein LBR73_06530 [Oscillospiraceae bacterium]|jgi:DNA-binding transcriptional MerR regulator|nr:hypothetical protein [Oscillospiraceae bacterium]
MNRYYDDRDIFRAEEKKLMKAISKQKGFSLRKLGNIIKLNAVLDQLSRNA